MTPQLDVHGDVLDVGPDVVGMRFHPRGARLAFRPRRWGERLPAWELAVSGAL